MKNIKFLLLTLFVLASSVSAAQDADKPLIYKINIKENIGSNTWIYLQNGLYEALNKKADCVVLHINTYGGSLMEADSMRTGILNCSLPVYAFIDNNAASAGALISIACDSIYMRRSASMGAATVVEGGTGEKATDKYQSYMRGIMRATAESKGNDTLFLNGNTVISWRRDPQIAEAMVDERVVVPGVSDSTQILTLTASQAIELGYCEGIVESLHEIATKHLGYSEYDIETYNPTFYDKIKGFLTNGVLQALLIMLIIGGIYFELQSPGIGFPTAIAITAAILYFTPLYLNGYAQHWEVLIFVLGLILIIFELFVIPGFGVAGISGIVLVISALILALVGNIDFNFKMIAPLELFRATMIVFAGLGLGFGAIIYLSGRIGKPGFLSKVALHADEEGFVSVSAEPVSLIGQTAIAQTVLRPSGKIKVGEEYYDAVAIKGYIEKGEKVIIRKYENFQLYVVRK